jgi:hypothetical protein
MVMRQRTVVVLNLLLGRMEALGFALQKEAELETLTLDVVKSSEIEGESLNPDQVRSSIARRLGLDDGGTEPADRQVRSDPAILGGTPVFAGTRVPVKNLLEYLAAGDSLESSSIISPLCHASRPWLRWKSPRTS